MGLVAIHSISMVHSFIQPTIKHKLQTTYSYGKQEYKDIFSSRKLYFWKNTIAILTTIYWSHKILEISLQ